MGLPRTKQRVQKSHSELGVIARRIFKTLLDLSQGRTSLAQGEWFYRLFIGDRYASVPDTAEGVRESLRSAWWVEEDDVFQQLLLFVFRDRHYLKSNTDEGAGLRVYLAYQLRDWLFTQRIFSRQLSWESDYQYLQQNVDPHQVQPGISLLFENSAHFDLFNRYLMYISIVLDLSLDEKSDILLTQTRQVNRFTAVLKNKMEELNARTT